MIQATTFIQEYNDATNEIIAIHAKAPQNDINEMMVSYLESKKEKLLQAFSEQCISNGLPLIFTEATISLFQANYTLGIILLLIEEEEDANDSLRIEALKYIKDIKTLGMSPDLDCTRIMDKLKEFALPETTDSEKREILSYCINRTTISLKDLIDIQQMIIRRMEDYKNTHAKIWWPERE